MLSCYYVDGSISVTLEGMHGYIHHWRDYFISDMNIALASALDVHPKHVSVSFEGTHGVRFRIFESSYDSLMSLISKMHSSLFTTIIVLNLFLFIIYFLLLLV